MHEPKQYNISMWKENKHRVNLQEVAISLLGDPVTRYGKIAYFPCPFHGGSEPTLKIIHGKPLWRCAHCGCGDAINLVRKVKNWSMVRACDYLSDPSFYFAEKELLPLREEPQGPQDKRFKPLSELAPEGEGCVDRSRRQRSERK